jgi:putative spermidine/putrescine transport system permease protein
MLMGAGRVHTTTTTVVQMLDQFLWPFGAALALILAAVGVICVALFAFATNRFMRGQS